MADAARMTAAADVRMPRVRVVLMGASQMLGRIERSPRYLPVVNSRERAGEQQVATNPPVNIGAPVRMPGFWCGLTDVGVHSVPRAPVTEDRSQGPEAGRDG